MRMEPDHEGLTILLRFVQDGVVSRSQLMGLGFAPHDVARMVRRRELARIHAGVFVSHTGAPTWSQRAWAAVLATGGVLTLDSALPRPRSSAPIQVAVDRHHHVRRSLDGVVVHRRSRLPDVVDPRASPPRVTLAVAAVEVAGRARDDHAAYRVLADALHTREVTHDQLRDALDLCPRLGRRLLLRLLISDLEEGTCSVLERAYARDVEQAHGLPRGRRQAPGLVDGRRALRDVRYDGWRTYVELDGRAFHDTPAARDRDLARDLAAAAQEDHATLRLGYHQVLREPCATALAVGRVLARNGWPGPVTSCPRCPQSVRGRSDAPGAPDRPH